jgi:hypothetical protein
MPKSTPLFSHNINNEFNNLLELFFSAVDTRASNILAEYATHFTEPVVSATLLRVKLHQALNFSLPEVFSVKNLAPIFSRLQGELPCTSDEFATRVSQAAIRPVEHDLLFLLLYGLRYGIEGSELTVVPLQKMTFVFELDLSLAKVRLKEISFAMDETATSYVTSHTTSSTFSREGLKILREPGPLKESFGLALEIPFSDVAASIVDLLEWVPNDRRSAQDYPQETTTANGPAKVGP